MLTTSTRSADDIFHAAFDRPRSPRSDAYRAGVLDVLRSKEAGQRIEGVPYAPGSAEADAYYAGAAEGHALWRAR